MHACKWDNIRPSKPLLSLKKICGLNLVLSFLKNMVDGKKPRWSNNLSENTWIIIREAEDSGDGKGKEKRSINSNKVD